MATYIYDGSFEGLLSCAFTAIATRTTPHAIVEQHCYQQELLDQTINIVTDDLQADRVLRGINLRTNGAAANLVYKMFLSELPQIAMAIFHVIQTIVSSKSPDILENFANSDILKAAQIEKMINREIHRMHAFVRFQKTHTGLFYAVIEPDFNVMPLLGDHFARRYADQSWVIFDSKRQYGIYYHSETICFIAAGHSVLPNRPGDLQATALDSEEKLYQALWTNYFHCVNIPQRNNQQLHLRHMPKRYWKYLTEKTYPRVRDTQIPTAAKAPHPVHSHADPCS